MLKNTANALIFTAYAAALHVEQSMADEPKPRLQAGKPEFLKGDAADDCYAGAWTNPDNAGTNVFSYTIGTTPSGTTFVTPPADASTPKELISNIPNSTLVAACTAVTYTLTADSTYGISYVAPNLKIALTDTTLAKVDHVVTVTPGYSSSTAGVAGAGWTAFTYKLTLLDPCLTPDSLTAPTLAE